MSEKSRNRKQRENKVRQALGDAVKAGRPEAKVPVPNYSSRHFWIVLSAVLLLTVAIKLPTLRFPHQEPDEQVYLTLAGQLYNSHSYTLQDTPIIYDLSPSIYDRPLFFHPPLFPILLIPFLHWHAPNLGVVVSWIGHLLTVMAVALMGRRLVFLEGTKPPDLELAEWLPVVAVAFDPLLTFISRRLWIDSLLTGLCAISLAALFTARYSSRRTIWLILGGLLFGLATITKAVAFVLLALVLYLVLTPEKHQRSRIRDVVLAGAPLLLLALPWYLKFYHTYGVLFPNWIKPDEWTLQHYPFVRTTLERTPVFYLTKLASIAPVSVIAIGAYCFQGRLWTSGRFLVAPAWFSLCFASVSYLGVHGTGFQMRYLAPLVPSIYLMLYAAFSYKPPARSFISIAILLLMLVGAMTSAIYLVSPHFDEIYNLYELTRFATAP